MATYPRTGSVLDSTTRTSLSTQIVVMVNNEPVGAIQNFNVNQQRPLREINEVGTDGNIEIVPNSSAKYSITIERIVFDGLSLPEAFSRGFVNIKSQRIPFDIVAIDQNTGTGDDALITTYRNCWFEGITKAYRSSEFVIQESVTVKCEDVSSMRAGEAIALSQGTGGGRQVPTQIDQVELLTDSGSRRGSLDFPGLISAAF